MRNAAPFRVVVPVTEIAPLYWVSVSVGFEPSVAERRVPWNVEEVVTLWSRTTCAGLG